MTEDEKLKLNLSLSEKLLKLVLNEKIPFEKKIGNMDYLIRLGADVNKQVYGKSIALWAKELGDDDVVKYVKENGGVEFRISKEESDEFGCQFWDENGEVKSFKEIKELVLMGADLSVKNNNDEQIGKYLSLEEMNEVLKDLPKGYVIEGDVDLREKGLIELPDFSKIKVGGDFYCSYNELRTLEGAPSVVGESFYCHENQLTDLKGAPSVVGGSFYCYNNQLTSLEGAPSEVGGSFNCYENQLTSLEGAPREVGGGFYCHKNQLTDLKGAPREVGGGFNCGGNQLTSLEGAPREVGGSFDCRRNQLTTLQGAPKKVEGSFDCSDNQLTDLKGAPEKVGGDFNCSRNQLTALQGAPEKVGGYFNCIKNQLTTLQGAPEKVGGDFRCHHNNKLATLDGKPKKIGGEFEIEEKVLARIEEAEKKKKNNAVMGFIRNLIEM